MYITRKRWAWCCEGLRVLSYHLVDQCEAVLPCGNCCKRKRRHAYLCELAIGYRILDAYTQSDDIQAQTRMLGVREFCHVRARGCEQREREREKLSIYFQFISSILYPIIYMLYPL